MIKLALIECGSHSRANHIPALHHYARDHPSEVELTAVCDLNRDLASEVAAGGGFSRVHTDYRAMVETEEIDGCVCVMPIELTASLAKDLLRRGMPCTIEKPTAATLADARSIVEVAGETGTMAPRLQCWRENELVIDERPPSEQPMHVRIGPYGETAEFVTALAEGRRPWPSVEEVYPSIALAFELDPSKET